MVGKKRIFDMIWRYTQNPIPPFTHARHHRNNTCIVFSNGMQTLFAKKRCNRYEFLLSIKRCKQSDAYVITNSTFYVYASSKHLILKHESQGI